MVTPTWDELLQNVLSEQPRPASPSAGSQAGSSPATSPARAPRLPWDQRLEETRQWRQMQLQEKWEGIAALRLARSEEFLERTEDERERFREWAEEKRLAGVRRDEHIKAMWAAYQAEHLMKVRRQKQRRNEQQKQRKEAEREKQNAKEQKEAARNGRLEAKRKEMREAMADGGNLKSRAESDIFDVLEKHKREREDWEREANDLQATNDRRAQAYKRKLEKMALQKSRGEMTREMTYERAPAITEKIRGQGDDRMDPAERARLAELNRLKKRERELEERREKIEAHRHIVEHHEAFRAAEMKQADENWRKHEEELLEMQHMRATLPNRFTDDLKKRTVELGKTTNRKLARFKASQAKINGDKEEYCRSFGETLKKSMSDHEMRRANLEKEYKYSLEETGKLRTTKTEDCWDFLDKRGRKRDAKGREDEAAFDDRLAKREAARIAALQDSSAEFMAKSKRYQESKKTKNDRFMLATAMEGWRRSMQVQSKQQQRLEEVPYTGMDMETHTLAMWNTRKCGRLQNEGGRTSDCLVWRMPPVGDNVDIIKAVKMYRKSKKERDATFLTATDAHEAGEMYDPDSPKSSDGTQFQETVPLGASRPISPSSPVLTKRDLVLTLTKAFMARRVAPAAERVAAQEAVFTAILGDPSTPLTEISDEISDEELAALARATGLDPA